MQFHRGDRCFCLGCLRLGPAEVAEQMRNERVLKQALKQANKDILADGGPFLILPDEPQTNSRSKDGA